MKADLLQALAICAHGNAFLQSSEGRPPELLAIGPFARTKEIAFRRVGSNHAPQLVADSVAPWLRKLQSEGVTHIRLHTGNLSMDPRVITLDGWGVITEGNHGVELWTPFWRTHLTQAHDPKPFIVSYTGDRVSRYLLPAVTDLETARQQVRQQLNDTVEAIQAVGEAHTAIPLAHCRSLTDQGNTNLRSFRDALPNSLDDARKAIAAEAFRIAQTLNAPAWLDLVEQLDQPSKDQIQALWKAVMKATEAVAG